MFLRNRSSDFTLFAQGDGFDDLCPASHSRRGKPLASPLLSSFSLSASRMRRRISYPSTHCAFHDIAPRQLSAGGRLRTSPTRSWTVWTVSFWGLRRCAAEPIAGVAGALDSQVFDLSPPPLLNHDPLCVSTPPQYRGCFPLAALQAVLATAREAEKVRRAAAPRGSSVLPIPLQQQEQQQDGRRRESLPLRPLSCFVPVR